MPDKRKLQAVSISSLLSDNNRKLGALLQHVHFLRRLEDKLHAHLGPPLNTHCSLANFAKDTLTLHSDSSIWAAKLRYTAPDILSYLQNECKLSSLKNIRIKVIPTAGPTQKTSHKRLMLSATSARYLAEVATSMRDNDLQKSLFKLSRHGK
jgi:hypothetical protein